VEGQSGKWNTQQFQAQSLHCRPITQYVYKGVNIEASLDLLTQSFTATYLYSSLINKYIKSVNTTAIIMPRIRSHRIHGLQPARLDHEAHSYTILLDCRAEEGSPAFRSLLQNKLLTLESNPQHRY